MALALAMPVTGGSAQAVPTTLYVDNGPDAQCSDQGAGTQVQPYCTVTAAAAVVQPGQTVLVAYGTGAYPQELDITRSGTAAAPITFKGLPGPTYTGEALPTIGDDTDPDQLTLHGIVVQGAQHVVVEGLSPVGQFDSIAVTGGSKDVTVQRNILLLSGIAVSGSTGTVVSTNAVAMMAEYPSVTVSASPGTVVTSNTLGSNCHAGLLFDGASAGAVVENNVVDTAPLDPPCPSGSEDTAITVPTGSTTGTKVAYNFIGTTSGGAAYQWGAKTYRTVASFTTASKQGSHDILGDTGVGQDYENVATQAVDSADANAPDELSADLRGNPRVNVRSVADTGTGAGYYDRGALEQGTTSAYQPLAPSRVLDTRNATGVHTTTPVPAGGATTITLGSANKVPAGASAVVLNVTVTGGTKSGTLKVTPQSPVDAEGNPIPISQVVASDLTWAAGRTTSNLVIVHAGTDPITFTNLSSGSVHVVADLEGYYSKTAPNGYSAVAPARLLDTRNGTGRSGKSPLGQGGVLKLAVTGSHGVPTTARAVVLNVTSTASTASSYLTVYPDGQSRPVASNLNFVAKQTQASLVVVPVGSDGKVDFYNHAGSTHVIADVEGYYSATAPSTFVPYGPSRVLNGAQNGVPATPTRLAAGASVTVPISDLEGLVGGKTTATALNLTVEGTTGTGYLTVYPYGSKQPVVSNANWTKGQTVTNLVMVPTGSNKVVITNHSTGSVELLGDLEGDFFNS